MFIDFETTIERPINAKYVLLSDFVEKGNLPSAKLF